MDCCGDGCLTLLAFPWELLGAALESPAGCAKLALWLAVLGVLCWLLWYLDPAVWVWYVSIGGYLGLSLAYLLWQSEPREV